jgi:hypothetical protein
MRAAFPPLLDPIALATVVETISPTAGSGSPPPRLPLPLWSVCVGSIQMKGPGPDGCGHLHQTLATPSKVHSTLLHPSPFSIGNPPFQISSGFVLFRFSRLPNSINLLFITYSFVTYTDGSLRSRISASAPSYSHGTI